MRLSELLYVDPYSEDKLQYFQFIMRSDKCLSKIRVTLGTVVTHCFGVMFCPPFPHEALRIFYGKSLQRGQTNFLGGNYEAS
jgi:NAD-dependent DNA ligase